MSNNPFAPPRAYVADVSTQQVSERPGEVRTAVILLWFGVGLGWMSAALEWEYGTPKGSAGLFVFGMLFGLVLVGWLFAKIWHGRNWARITLLVLLVISLPAFLMQLPEVNQRTATGAWLSGVQLLVQLGAVWLLFSAQGRVWFRRKRE